MTVRVPCLQAYSMRRTAIAQGRSLAELNPQHGAFPGALPPMLTLQPGQITKQQQQVYEDFPRVPRAANQVRAP